MKKTFLVLLITLFSVSYFGCNKDNPVSSTGGGTTTRTNSFGKINGTVPINTGLNQDLINVDTSGTINSLIFTLDTILNTNAQQLVIFIEHSGVRDTLVNQPPNAGTDFKGTVFRDDAPNSINTGSGTYTGSYKPYSPLSVFNGKSINGQWTLYIYSVVSGRSGVIKAWSVTINYTPSLTQFFALAIGNKFITEERDTSGNLLFIDTATIPYSMQYNGKTIYRLIPSGNPLDTFFISNESDGLWMHSISQNISRLLFKYPINVGEWFLGGTDGGLDTITCLSNNATLVTPLQTFTGCYLYKSIHYGGSITTRYHYVKLGLWLVGEDRYDNSVLTRRDRLIYYELHK